LDDVKKLKQTSKDAPNRAGKVFTVHEFKSLLTTIWIVSMASQISLVEWIILGFCAKSFLLGALRMEQFERFRAGGLASITFYRNNRDDANNLQPIRTKMYGLRSAAKHWSVIDVTRVKISEM